MRVPSIFSRKLELCGIKYSGEAEMLATHEHRISDGQLSISIATSADSRIGGRAAVPLARWPVV